MDKRDERKNVKNSIGNPKLIDRQVKTECSFNREGSVDTVNGLLRPKAKT